MNWEIFWSAFGAIGTTIGSLLTAGAVLIAVKQYKQPLEKIVKVEFKAAISLDTISSKPLNFYCITVKNKGIRHVQINSINIQGNKKILWINNAQYDHSYTKINLPVKIAPEESIDFFFEVGDFKIQLKKAVENKVFKEKQKLVIFITDSLGDNYFCKTKIAINKIIA